MNDKREGKGRYTYKAGGWFEGFWKEDTPFGDGIYADESGAQYSGIWKERSKKRSAVRLMQGEEWVGQTMHAYDNVSVDKHLV